MFADIAGVAYIQTKYLLLQIRYCRLHLLFCAVREFRTLRWSEYTYGHALRVNMLSWQFPTNWFGEERYTVKIFLSSKTKAIVYTAYEYWDLASANATQVQSNLQWRCLPRAPELHITTSTDINTAPSCTLPISFTQPLTLKQSHSYTFTQTLHVSKPSRSKSRNASHTPHPVAEASNNAPSHPGAASFIFFFNLPYIHNWTNRRIMTENNITM